MHEYAPLAITLVAIFAGILVNKSDLNSLQADQKADLAQLRTEMNRNFERVDKQIDEVTVGSSALKPISASSTRSRES